MVIKGNDGAYFGIEFLYKFAKVRKMFTEAYAANISCDNYPKAIEFAHLIKDRDLNIDDLKLVERILSQKVEKLTI